MTIFVIPESQYRQYEMALKPEDRVSSAILGDIGLFNVGILDAWLVPTNTSYYETLPEPYSSTFEKVIHA